eukprot:Ihof_evm2s527 gene=Ihof_evmTU2s527
MGKVEERIQTEKGEAKCPISRCCRCICSLQTALFFLVLVLSTGLWFGMNEYGVTYRAFDVTQKEYTMCKFQLQSVSTRGKKERALLNKQVLELTNEVEKMKRDFSQRDKETERLQNDSKGCREEVSRIDELLSKTTIEKHELQKTFDAERAASGAHAEELKQVKAKLATLETKAAEPDHAAIDIETMKLELSSLKKELAKAEKNVMIAEEK